MCLCAFAYANAQTTITGRVMDGAANESAIGASVLVVGTSIGTITDYDGNFTIEVPEGKFILQVSMVGYKTQVINIMKQIDPTNSSKYDAINSNSSK